MTVPSREEAARLLLSLDPPEWHLRHSRAVAEIAGWLALRVERRARRGPTAAGRSRDARRPPRDALRGPVGPLRPLEVPEPVDRRLVEAAALLHDVDKAIRRRVRGDGPHGEAGARWLAGHGHPELGEAVALHPVTLLVDRGGAARLRNGSLEARLVAYADKRAGQGLEPMATRFARWRRRHPERRALDSWSPGVARAAWDRARRLEREVCAIAGCRPEEVGRLRWTTTALGLARRPLARRGPARRAPGSRGPESRGKAPS
ncbi:MAG TPA: HD domain-containing protein [Candidatus Limnocylindrales bacterium]|nr:HD domain-containing protein [Candidatus Limnocylindrales bacterium]